MQGWVMAHRSGTRRLERGSIDELQSALHGYRSKIETHIRPALGNLRLSSGQE
jgi:hypothetical protein